MPKNNQEKSIREFNKDTIEHGGYTYTSNSQLSSFIANKHITDITLQLVSLKNKHVLDIGCGDGTYTLELLKRGRPKSIHGFDPSSGAIKSAQKKAGNTPNISLACHSIYEFQPGKRYDLVIVRGIIHHLYHPRLAMNTICQAGKKILIIEPNGYNPILKLIEKLSKYHRDHEEKSYFPLVIDRWIKQNGGRITNRHFAGLVPFFCPDWLAKLLKLIEPLVEKLPVFNLLLCGGYYIVIESTP